jgi:membrane protease YdiL (CAAX protease family)
MKDFVSRHALLFSVVVVLVYDFGMQGLGALLKAIPGLGLTPLAVGLIVQGIFCVLIVALIHYLRWWRESGFQRPVSSLVLFAYLPWLLLPLLVMMGAESATRSSGLVIAYAVMMLLVGFGEEALMRGVVLRALLPGGMMRAAVVSSLIFGVAHFFNVFQGHGVAPTIAQVIYAAFIGMGFAGPRLFAGTIWPAIFLHGLIDFADVASRNFTPVAEVTKATPFNLGQAITAIAITGCYALYGWWLIRRLRKRQRQAEGAS